ncbi:MAG TPA: 2-hydroxyacid dehydrogenase [Caulobacteraceae bacterium]|nr:2-hydroxyacid dehydrogenase [Caulobacteraceae bacterium]
MDGYAAEVWTGGDFPANAGEVEVVVLPLLYTRPRLGELRRLPRLRLVQTQSAGVDKVTPHVPPGAVLCSAKGANDTSTAEWVLAALLADARELPRRFADQQEGRWRPTFTSTLAGKTVLLVGYGSIAKAVEQRLAGFEVEIVRVARGERPGVHAATALPALLGQADAVVLLAPLTDETRGLVDAEFLGRMRDGAVLINAARGELVVTEAFLEEARRGRLRGVLDVTDPEPLPADHALWSTPGVIVTPHIAGATHLMRPRVVRLIGAQLARYRDGAPLENVVPRGQPA